MDPKPGLPSFWSTTLARVIVGEQPCYLSPWMDGRYDLPDDPDGKARMAKWKSDHTTLLDAVVERYAEQGWTIDKERFFRVKGQTAVLSGKADLIGQKLDHRPRIVDAKSGKPRDSDVAQVIVEIVMVPLSWKRPEMQFEGEVVYAGNPSVQITHQQAMALKPKLMATLRELGTMPRPTPRPSRDACRFCKVPESECAVRFKDVDADAETMEF